MSARVLRKIHLANLRNRAKDRPPGYVEDVLAHAERQDGQHYWIADGDWWKLAAKYRGLTPPPHVATDAMDRIAADAREGYYHDVIGECQKRCSRRADCPVGRAAARRPCVAVSKLQGGAPCLTGAIQPWPEFLREYQRDAVQMTGRCPYAVRACCGQPASCQITGGTCEDPTNAECSIRQSASARSASPVRQSRPGSEMT